MTVVSDYLHVGSGEYSVEVLKPISDVDKLVDQALKGDIPNEVNNFFSQEMYLMNHYEGKTVIPGSTIKGMVRTRLELAIPGSCYIVDSRGSNYSPRYKSIFKPEHKKSDRFDPEDYPNVCPVCNLLGNSGLASRVNFSDFVSSDKTDVIKISNVGYEVAKKGARFSGKVVYNSLSKEELGMLFYGFGIRVQNGRVLSKVQLLGRFKYEDKRFGRVTFSIGAVNSSDVISSIQAFQTKYRPRDFKEDW
ncbi:hypothetical protein B6F84_00035 [Acidianus manzaensis]|uniref:CRISPR type III-associated protein domain-containing protein n=2 Tax=Acidianus manzaensis TaxID=282676 RepID=A0A1W6K370_9CREN|nr:hypothetical protein B6F84_00035 [Acidianus manzaensis]